MTLPFFGRGRLIAAPAGDRLGRLRKVLAKSGFDHSVQDPESALAKLPTQEPPVQLAAGPEQALEFPFKATERIAVLVPGFSPSRNIQRFDSADLAGLQAYQPQAIAAPLRDLQRLAVLQNKIHLDHALVVLTSVEKPVLSENERETLWRSWGVPVFEFLRAWDGTVIARECQVHDGLHVADDMVIPHFAEGELLLTQINRLDAPAIRARTGIGGEMVTQHCECGRETPRLRALARLHQRAVAAAA